jgi:hypothetical protein
MLSFFKDLTLYLSENLASLQLRLSIIGITLQETPYAQMIESMPDSGHFAVLQGEQTLCALYTDATLISGLTERILGNKLESPPTESYLLSFSEDFCFKEWCRWVIAFFEQRKVALSLQRTEKWSRDLHLCFHDETVTCVTISLKLQTTPVHLYIIVPQKDLQNEMELETRA